jgi:hypothetical protein
MCDEFHAKMKGVEKIQSIELNLPSDDEEVEKERGSSSSWEDASVNSVLELSSGPKMYKKLEDRACLMQEYSRLAQQESLNTDARITFMNVIHNPKNCWVS